MKPLDDIFFYQPDTCINEEMILRYKARKMGKEEAEMFWYHIGECEKCREFMRVWLAKNKH